jgi:integrase
MILNGIDLKTVQARLGHSSAAVTMSVYLHSFNSAQAAAADAISSAISLK